MMYDYSNTIKQISNIPLDVHLMVEDVKENIDRYIPLEPSIITFHFEACKNDEEVIVVSVDIDSLMYGSSLPSANMEVILKKKTEVGANTSCAAGIKPVGESRRIEPSGPFKRLLKRFNGKKVRN